MTRKAFLETLGLGAAFVLTTACLGGCSDEAVLPVDFTLNLDDAANAALKNNGGYIVTNGVVVARTTAGEYVAATRTCSHEGRNEVIYKSNEWYCTAHGARFSLGGDGLNADGSKGLTVYSTSLTGTLLRVFS